MEGKARVQALRLQGPVRITMPAAVAYDLDALQKGIASIAERIGCRACFSGADCTFQLERDFVINEALEPRSAARLPQDPVPFKNVQVNLAPEVSFSIDRLQGAIERIVDKLGHSACFSGFDIAFGNEIRVLNVSRELEVEAFGRF